MSVRNLSSAVIAQHPQWRALFLSRWLVFRRSSPRPVRLGLAAGLPLPQLQPIVVAARCLRWRLQRLRARFRNPLPDRSRADRTPHAPDVAAAFPRRSAEGRHAPRHLVFCGPSFRPFPDPAGGRRWPIVLRRARLERFRAEHLQLRLRRCLFAQFLAPGFVRCATRPDPWPLVALVLRQPHLQDLQREALPGPLKRPPRCEECV